MPELITHDRFEGLDPQIAAKLRNFETVEGEAWDEVGDKKTKVTLRDYNHVAEYPFKSSEGGGFRYFTPSYEEETDWSKIEVDDPVIIDQDGEQLKRHFAKFENGSVYTFNDGLTSFTATNGETTAWIPCQCRLAKEGE